MIKLDVDKLKPIPTDLIKLSDVVKNDVVKKTDYDKLVAKVDNIDTSGLVKKTDYNTKISEIEGKIPDTSSLATKTALSAVENKIPSISDLVKKTDYDTKITEIEKKLTDHKNDEYIDSSEFNTLATNVFNTRIAQANLITETDFDAKLSSLNRKITKNKSDHLLVQNRLNKLKAFDSSYFIGKNHFEEDGAQNYLVFPPIYRYFTVITDTDFISSWKSKQLSDESFKPPTTSDNSLTPSLDYHGNKISVKFKSCLRQSNKLLYTHRKIVNIYIVYELGASTSHSSDPTTKNYLFGAVTLTKNADIEKYRYSGYGIGFDRRSSFSFPSGGFGQNVLIFGADMSSSIHIYNKKDVLVLGRRPTQGLESTLTAEKMYSINFTVTKKKFCLSLHYNGANSYLFVNGTQIIKFKAKDSKIVASPLCLDNISKDWSRDNMKKTGLTSYVYDFSEDYNAIAVDDVKDIHNYLMKKNNIP